MCVATHSEHHRRCNLSPHRNVTNKSQICLSGDLQKNGTDIFDVFIQASYGTKPHGGHL